MALLFVDSKESTQESFNLSTLKESKINSIEITRLTGDALKFIKETNQWRMVSPYKVRANNFYIESLLQITHAKSSSQFTISKNDNNKFKLNPPQASLKLNEQLFLFGTNEQLNLNRYISTNNKLYLIPDRYFYILNSYTTGFIDHALIGKNEIITGLTLAKYDLALKNGKWQLKPASKNITADDIVQLISEWNNSQAIEITKPNEIDKTSIDYSIKLTLKNNPVPVIFDISLKENFYLFTRPDLKLQYKLNHDMANRLLKISGQ